MRLQNRNARRRGPAAPAAPGPASSSAEAPGPTRETVRKLRADVVGKLAAAGRLAPEQLRAAAELRRLHEALARALAPSARWIDGTRVDTRMAPRDPFDTLGAGLEIVWRRRWRGWAAEAGAARVAGARPAVSARALVLAIVVDNLGTRQADDRWGLRRGRATAELQRWLWRYAEGAGWIDPARLARLGQGGPGHGGDVTAPRPAPESQPALERDVSHTVL
ncbi:MAG: hypothetical protein AB7N54_13220 [Alphaproteobacteria bacterium]